MTIRSYFSELFLEASIHWGKAVENVVHMREPVKKKKTPLGWAWEKIHVGGAKLVWRGWHNFANTFYKHSWHFPDCVAKRLTALENGGLKGISRLRVAHGQTQEQRAARFHDPQQGGAMINSHHRVYASKPQRMQSVLSQGHLKLEVIASTLSIRGRDHSCSTAIMKHNKKSEMC